MKKKDVRKEIIEYTENELGIIFGEDILLAERYQEAYRGDEILETFKIACEDMYSVTIDEERFDLAETVQELLDECVDSVIDEDEDS